MEKIGLLEKVIVFGFIGMAYSVASTVVVLLVARILGIHLPFGPRW